MEKVYKENNDGTINVACTYKYEEYAPIAHKVQVNLCSNVTVNGFRKGKAPLDVAIKYVDPQKIYNKMLDKLIDQDFATLLDGYDINKVANVQPSLSVNYDDKAKTYTLTYTYYLLPVAEIKQDKGLDIKVETKKVTKEDISKKIDALLTDNAELVPAKDDELAANGDHVIIDFTGYVDGKEFDGGSAKDYELTLGSNSFVPGFEDQIIGFKQGEQKTIEITFPENYVESLKGKKAKFSIKVKTIKKVVKPKLNDEFATTLDSYKVKTVAELEDAIKKELQASNKQQAEDEKLDKVMEAILKDAKIIVSDKYISTVKDSVLNNQINQFKQYGLTLDDYLKMTGTTKETLDANCLSQAKAQANTFAILRSIAINNNLKVEQSEIEEYFGGKEKYDSLMKTAKEQAGKNPNFSIESYIDGIKQDLLDKKAKKFLLDNN